MNKKLDTRAIGLDAGLHFIKWLTGAENLHYGLWEGLEPKAENLRRAQDAYTDLLFSYLPEGPLRILDIGGGAGETARKLTELGHSVQIVVPSPLLAERCRANAPKAHVHLCRFEEFQSEDRFDLCLFSESFQYIPLRFGLRHALGLLKPGGEVLVADCFRLPGFKDGDEVKVGGGHSLHAFEKLIGKLDVELVTQKDITRSVAPSIDLEQGLFNVLGHVLTQLDEELSQKRPGFRWFAHRVVRSLISKRRRHRLAVRLMEQTRNSEVFCAFNSYQIFRLRSRPS